MSRRLQLSEYAGHVMLFDEILTMSARMAAATGDLTYKTRYDKYDAQLDALLMETETLRQERQVRIFVIQTDRANRKLVAMERRAFALVSGGRRSEASALLVSADYMKWKRQYADGVEATSAWHEGAVKRDDDDLRELVLAAAALNVVFANIIVFAWYFVIRAVRRWREGRSEANSAHL